MKRWSKFSILVFCAAFLTQFSLQGQSVQIHSHNDYQKSLPFYRAYSQQVDCMEADVYIDSLSETGLLVGHDPQDLATALDIEEVYIKPIVFVFAQHGGRPWRNSERTFTLMVDLKTPLHPTIDRLIAKLKKYPEVFDPSVNPYAVKVVITGSRPTPADFEKYPKFIFFDGFIEERYSPEQLERVTVISEPFFTYSKWKANGDTLSDSDRKAIVGVVEKAHEMGKPIRFWASPDNPQAWETLHNLGVDVINTDNPEACTLYFRALEKK